MRRVIGGNGTDTTAAVVAFSRANNLLLQTDLILIGEIWNPRSVFLTTWQSALVYSQIGTFLPATIKREGVSSKIGVDAATMKLTWTPKAIQTFTNNTLTASPIQLALQGYYDNWRVRMWRCFMPTSGDANTFGATPWFGGFVSQVQVDRGKIIIDVNDYRYALNYKVPPNVVEVTNSYSHFTGALPPKGFSHIPQFGVKSPSTPSVILGDTLPLNGFTAHHIFARGDFNNPMAWLVFNSGPGATLAGFAAPIGANAPFTDVAIQYNQFSIYGALPWAPTPFASGSGDTFYVSRAPTISQLDATGFGDPYGGFPFVPYPSSTP